MADRQGPSPDDARRAERRQLWLALCLVMTAGYVDAYGISALGAFVSVMSGNTTLTGFSLGGRHLAVAAPPALAIAAFLAGSVLGVLVTDARPARAAHRRLFAVVALLLFVAALLGAAPARRLLCIPTLGLAMGMFNVALSRIGAEPISLTFVTGSLSRVGRHLALGLRGAPVDAPEGAWDSHLHRALINSLLWAAFLAGAILCGVLAPLDRNLALAPAVVVVIGLAVAGAS